MIAGAALAAAAWWFRTRRDTPPASIPAAVLSSWTLVVGNGGEPWIVGLKPSDSLGGLLFEQAARHEGRPLVRPPYQAVPLVLQSEFADSLQGVYGSDSIVRMAREGGIETATFHPVCLAHQSVDTRSGHVDLYFVPFDAPAFAQLRADITPLEPEHAGIGIYEPGLLTPILIVGATTNAFDELWPIRFDSERDCEEPIQIAP